jgi:hypothetical protein
MDRSGDVKLWNDSEKFGKALTVNLDTTKNDGRKKVRERERDTHWLRHMESGSFVY